MTRGGTAIVALIEDVVAAKAAGVSAEQLDRARDFQRKAQWRLDFIAAENSMGFHAPQEAARILGEAIDYARQGQLALLRPSPAASGAAAVAPPAASSASPPPAPSGAPR
jgi:nitrite reductase (cytochrome c-552)